MTWQWVAVLAIIVLAWTVHKVTTMWMGVSYYKYATDEVKTEIARATGVIK